MMLPFDPAEIEPEMYGEHTTVLETDHETAIETVREICLDEGFGIPVEFSPSDMLNEKVDAGRDPYYVLGACNPAIADRALTATDNKIGGLFPCNMIVWERAPNEQVVYHVSIMRIARMLGMAEDTEEMDAIIADTGELVGSVYDRLESL